MKYGEQLCLVNLFFNLFVTISYLRLFLVKFKNKIIFSSLRFIILLENWKFGFRVFPDIRFHHQELSFCCLLKLIIIKPPMSLTFLFPIVYCTKTYRVFPQTVPSAVYWRYIVLIERVFTEGTVFMRPAV